MQHHPTLLALASLSLTLLTGCVGEMDGSGGDAGSATPPDVDGGTTTPPPTGDGGATTTPGDGGVTPSPPAGDSGTTTPPPAPTSFRGIDERPYASTSLPSSSALDVGAPSCVGTPSLPAFIIGDGTEWAPPGGSWRLNAQYCIVANVNIRGRIRIEGANMVELRNVEVHHGDGAGISFGGTDVAVIDSHVHHMRGDNGHGVRPACGARRAWVKGNLLEYNDEDGFQAGHRCSGDEPDELYFYGNTCNNNRENCFDLKWTNRAVVSGNVMQRHRATGDGVFTYDDGSMSAMVGSGSDGSAVVVGSDGTPTLTFLFDNVYRDNAGCVRVEDAVDVYASGEDCADALSGARWGGYKFDKSGHTWLVDSTFEGVPFMITDDWRAFPVVDEANNTLMGGTEFRQGENATVTSGGVSDTDVAAAYSAAFGRPL